MEKFGESLKHNTKFLNEKTTFKGKKDVSKTKTYLWLWAKIKNCYTPEEFCPSQISPQRSIAPKKLIISIFFLSKLQENGKVFEIIIVKISLWPNITERKNLIQGDFGS